jgi:hypothetical protein
MPDTMAKILPFRRSTPAQHGATPTSPLAQHGRTTPLGCEVHLSAVEPLIDRISRRLGGDGYIVIDGTGRHVLDCTEPRGAA